MNQQPDEHTKTVRPKTVAQGYVYRLALAIIGTISFIEAVPHHLRFYAWCAWHFTVGQIILGFKLWRLRLEQQSIRRGNPYYRKERTFS